MSTSSAGATFAPHWARRLVLKPPRDRPRASVSSALYHTDCRVKCPDDRVIDHGGSVSLHLFCESLQHRVKHVGLTLVPAHAVSLVMFVQRVTLRRFCPGNPNHPPRCCRLSCEGRQPHHLSGSSNSETNAPSSSVLPSRWFKAASKRPLE